MGFFSDAWKGIKKFGKKVWDGIKNVGKAIWDAISSFVGCLFGIFGYGFEVLWNALANRGDRKKLSNRTKNIMRHFFPNLDLDKVRIRTHASLAIPGGRRALTMGYTIFFRGSFHECRYQDMQLLLHELVHVRQFEDSFLGGIGFACEYGAGTASTVSYENNPMEREAYDFERANKNELKQLVAEACAHEMAMERNRRSGGWFWLVWS